jgi:hypothetical protein
MPTLRTIVAVAFVVMLAGCAGGDPAALQARRDRKIPITLPKESAAGPLAVSPAESSPRTTQPAGASAPGELKAPTPATSRTASKPVPVEVVPVVAGASSKPTDTASKRSAASLPAKPSATPLGAVTVLGRPEIVEGPVVQVNNRFLSVDDLLRAACFDLDEIPKNLPEQAFLARVEKSLRGELQRQVSMALVLPEAEKALADEQKKALDTEIESTLRDMVARAGGSRKRLEENLADIGTTVQAVLEGQRNKLTVHMFLRMKFVPSVGVNRPMMWEYYRANLGQFSSPAKVAMQTVTVPLAAFLPAAESQPSSLERDAARAKARARIEEARKAIGAGEDFAAVADRFSTGSGNPPGGNWPLMPAGSFRQEAVEAAAFKLPEGGVSPIIETGEGFYIVKARQARPGSVKPFEDAQAEIERTLREKQSDKLYDEYYQRLTKGATITQPEGFLPLAAAQAVERFHDASVAAPRASRPAR